MYNKNRISSWLMISCDSETGYFGYDRLGYCSYGEAVKVAKRIVKDTKEELIESEIEVESVCYPTLKSDTGSINCSDSHVDFEILAVEDFIQKEE